MNKTSYSSARITKKEPEPEYKPPKMISRPISLMCKNNFHILKESKIFDQVLKNIK